MGTSIQKYPLTEADFRGSEFASHAKDLKGNNDLLTLTRPDVVRAVYMSYLQAGAHLCETNTFSSTSIAQADYQLEHLAYRLNFEAAKQLRSTIDEYLATDEGRGRDCFVCGAIGPTNRTLSLSPDVDRPAYRALTFDEAVKAYAEQVRGSADFAIRRLRVVCQWNFTRICLACWMAVPTFC